MRHIWKDRNGGNFMEKSYSQHVAIEGMIAIEGKTIVIYDINNMWIDFPHEKARFTYFHIVKVKYFSDQKIYMLVLGALKQKIDIEDIKRDFEKNHRFLVYLDEGSIAVFTDNIVTFQTVKRFFDKIVKVVIQKNGLFLESSM